MANLDNSMMDEVPVMNSELLLLKHQRIMVVEPERSICEFIQMALQDQGYSVSLALDAETANILIDSLNPQVLIAEMRILQTGSHRFFEHFKGLPINERCVIVLSTLPSDETQAKAIGADMFIAKPFDLDVLLQEILKCLSSSSIADLPE